MEQVTIPTALGRSGPEVFGGDGVVADVEVVVGGQRERTSPSDLINFARSDALPGAVFHELLESVARRFGVENAEVNFVADGTVWPKASVGSSDPASRDLFLCLQIATSGEPIVVNDAATDPRFTTGPGAHQAEGFVFYAGVPLIASDGSVCGTLCVLGTEPAWPDADQMEALAQAARYVVVLIEQCKALAELELERSVLSATGDVLAMIVAGAELPAVLDTLARAVQAAMPGTICSILLLRDSILYHGSAPDLPAEYWQSIEALPIGPSVGSCGTAAYTRTDQIVADIDTDPRWVDYRHLPEPFGLKACWSVPIMRPTGEVLGTFALYYREVRVPGLRDLRQMKRWANLGEVAISRARDMDELRIAAVLDPLTGLANRNEISRRLALAVGNQTADDNMVAVLFVDLDQFKFVNDTLGHAVGDELLIDVARRLADCVGPEDTVSRYGGDEFVVLCPSVPDASYAEGLGRRILAAVQRPMHSMARSVSLSASVGVALHRGAPSAGCTDLIGDADLAMYAAKRAGRSSVAVFTPDMRQDVLARLSLEAELSVALANHEIRCVYQPIVDLETGAVTAIEALMRWNSPTRGPVPPTVFIPVAEESGLIGELGDHILAQACRQLGEWRAASTAWQDVTMWVNVTVRQLEDSRFAARIHELLVENGLTAGHLGLEVTESHFVEETSKARAALVTLRDCGVHVAIDDFGTGYSSLAQLKHLPVDALKIDRQFVSGIDHAGSDATIVEAILELAGTFGLRVVAEGVETRSQRDRLRSLGCPLAQGHLWSRAVAATELDALVRRFERARWSDAGGGRRGLVAAGGPSGERFGRYIPVGPRAGRGRTPVGTAGGTQIRV